MDAAMSGWGPLWDWMWLWIAPLQLMGIVLLGVLVAIHVVTVHVMVSGIHRPRT